MGYLHEIRVPQAGVEFRVRIPGPLLAAWVDSYWVSEGIPLYPGERILADGTTVLIFNFGQPLRTVLGTQTSDLQQVSFAGVNTQFADVFHGGDRLQAGIRFKPGGAHAFFRLPVSEFHNQAVDVRLTGRQDLLDLYDAMAGAQLPDVRLALLEHWMLRTIRIAPAPDARVMHALGLLQRAPQLRVEALAQAANCSRQQLGRLFQTYAGASPKAFQRMFRLRHTLRRLHPGQPADWIGLAAAGEYFDQAHLIHEFHSLTGLSPAVYQQTLDQQVGRMLLR